MIPPAVQAPNLAQAGQQGTVQPAVAQQAFAQHLQRVASERPAQVQATVEAQASRQARVAADEERSPRERRLRRGTPPRGGSSGPRPR